MGEDEPFKVERVLEGRDGGERAVAYWKFFPVGKVLGLLSNKLTFFGVFNVSIFFRNKFVPLVASNLSVFRADAFQLKGDYGACHPLN